MSKESNSTQPDVGEVGPLFQQFSVPSYEDWRKTIEKALKGAPFTKKLVTPTYETIDLQPLYRLEDIANLPHLNSFPGFAPYVRGADSLDNLSQCWDISQELPYSTPEVFNEALRFDLERGQSAVNLVLDEATLAGQDADEAAPEAVGRGGVSISCVGDLDKALNGVDVEKMPLFIQAGAAALPFAALLMALLRRQGKAPAKLQGCLAADPLGTLARTGTLPHPLGEVYDRMARLTAWTATHAPQLQTIAVRGQPYHDGGGSAVQELVFALATGVEYLREMQARDLAIDQVAPRICFGFSLGSHFFMEIAKLRAARLLWAKIVKAFGGAEDAQRMTIHARTSAWNKTVYDPYVNMLRATVEAFAGVVGGCQSLHVAPFDAVARTPDEFSRRIARNTQLILREECQLPRTVDPAGGSWFVETLTDAVARKSWSLFQDVEKQGGMEQALQAGTPQAQVAEVAAQRATNLARRKDVFVGTNRYANLTEKPLDVPEVDVRSRQRERAAQLAQYQKAADAAGCRQALDKLTQDGAELLEAAIAAAGSGATLGDITRALARGEAAGPTLKPICVHRGAQPFEALRQATDAYAARTGARPQVFLAGMGPLSQHKARSDFARGFLEVGGFAVSGGEGFAGIDEAFKAALAAETAVVVICSTDAAYPDMVPALTQQLKAAKPEMTVLVAGYPADQVEAFRRAGVDDFIYLGANCYEILRNLQNTMGVLS